MEEGGEFQTFGVALIRNQRKAKDRSVRGTYKK